MISRRSFLKFLAAVPVVGVAFRETALATDGIVNHLNMTPTAATEELFRDIRFTLQERWLSPGEHDA